MLCLYSLNLASPDVVSQFKIQHFITWIIVIIIYRFIVSAKRPKTMRLLPPYFNWKLELNNVGSLAPRRAIYLTACSCLLMNKYLLSNQLLVQKFQTRNSGLVKFYYSFSSLVWTPQRTIPTISLNLSRPTTRDILYNLLALIHRVESHSDTALGSKLF